MNREQQLIDICFSVGLMLHDPCSREEDKSSYFKGKSNEEVAEWIASQLEACGFPTKPMGSSWGVLVK